MGAPGASVAFAGCRRPPPLDEDHESEDTIDIVLRAPGALGVELQERVKEGQSSLVIAGLEPQGQAKPAVAQLGLSIDDVKDACWLLSMARSVREEIATTSSDG